jgi:hypothetical protein
MRFRVRFQAGQVAISARSLLMRSQSSSRRPVSTSIWAVRSHPSRFQKYPTTQNAATTKMARYAEKKSVAVPSLAPIGETAV